MEIEQVIPTNGRLLLKLIEQADTQKTGLVMINGQMQNYLMGEVLATSGDGEFDKYKVGDKVLVLKYGVDEVTVKGEKQYLVESINIIALIK